MDPLCRLRNLAVIAGCIAAAPLIFAASGAPAFVVLAPDGHALLAHTSQGYLGVVVNDVDGDRVSALKLKDARGAEVVKLDQDAPAAKAGLKVHDVIVQMNGQQVEGVEQLRRMLRETPAGRTVAFAVVRDGQPVNVSVQLADRTQLATKSMDGIMTVPEPGDAPEVYGLSGDRHGFPGGLGMFGSAPRDFNSVGVTLQPLSTQLADYFGVKDGTGLLVASVFDNTPAAAAGFKAADVILKVNGESVVSLNTWEHAIRSHRGQPVQVTVMRNKKEQTLTMTPEAKTKGEIDYPDFDLPDTQVLMAEAQRDIAAIDPETLAAQVREATKGLDAERLKLQADRAVRSVDRAQIQEALKLNQKEMEKNRKQIEQQMKQLQESLKPLQFDEMD